LAEQEDANMVSLLAQMAVIAALALAPILGLLLARKRLGALNVAAWLITYGAWIIAGEHTLVGLGEVANLPRLPAHAHFHFLMGGIYTFVGAVLLGVVAWTLLRTGSRSGWYTILFALVVGGSMELWAASTIFPHGFPPQSIPLGLFLYAYIPAFACALAISYQPIFRSKAGKQLAN
jgi:hypothetical protein